MYDLHYLRLEWVKTQQNMKLIITYENYSTYSLALQLTADYSAMSTKFSVVYDSHCRLFRVCSPLHERNIASYWNYVLLFTIVFI